MFPNLKAEMARNGITCKDIGESIGKSSSWLESRLQGKAKLPIDVAMIIKQQFFPYAGYEYLFADKPMIEQGEKGA